MLESTSLRSLVQSFADPRIGAVSGVYQVKRRDEAKLGRQEDFYWRYETFLKTQESSIASILGAHGSLYGIRKNLYPFPRRDTINDDYVIPLKIVQQGYRVVYEPGAVAWEEAHEMQGFGRRVRIMRGNVQQMREIVPLLFPPRPFELFFFLSHKVGRLAVPFAMAAAATANLFLFNTHLFYVATGAMQIVFYALVSANAIRPLTPKLLRLPFYFFMINAAAIIAMYQVAFRRQRIAWK
jgi:cellulose synthase/poly-beta-1,6-N-acetylglucosamine synthase-like glycosyltransferase